MKIKFLLSLLFAITFYTIQAQIIDYTGFEDFEDGDRFTQSSWISEGFNVSWVNGFDQNRAHVDNKYARIGTKSLRISYPAGSYGPQNNGAQAPLQVNGENELFMSYWVRFSENFDWGGEYEGGKLPGLAGGNNCAGCINCTGNNGFTARLMWRTEGKGVLYLYHMDKENDCGDNFTLQFSGEDFYFEKGIWYKIIERVKINSGENHDGEVEVWVNEEHALLVTGLQFASNGDKVDNLAFSTFHGGNSSSWSPSVNCYIWFDEITIANKASDVFNFSGIEDDSMNSKILIFPNPVSSNSELNFIFDNITQSNYKTEWLSVSGSIVKKSETNTGSSISVPDLYPGIYMLKLTMDKEVIYKKIVIE